MKETGKIFWHDLTVANATEIRDFYSAVVGWSFQEVKQGDYNDYNMVSASANNEVVAGICHKRGDLINIPSQWLNYVMVDDMNISIERCISLGGKIIDAPKNMGKVRFTVIQDPAGAYMALMQE